MSGIHTTVVGDAHPYTHSKSPWRLEAYTQAHGETSSGKRFGWKLFHYLSGGGMRTFGRTVGQDEVLTRQRRFLIVAGVLGVLWLVAWVW